MRFVFALFIALVTPLAWAAPGEGDPAPGFSMQGSDGNGYTAESLAGKPYVIAFFPKVFTGG